MLGVVAGVGLVLAVPSLVGATSTTAALSAALSGVRAADSYARPLASVLRMAELRVQADLTHLDAADADLAAAGLADGRTAGARAKLVAAATAVAEAQQLATDAQADLDGALAQTRKDAATPT